MQIKNLFLQFSFGYYNNTIMIYICWENKILFYAMAKVWCKDSFGEKLLCKNSKRTLK